MERILNPISVDGYTPRGKKTRAEVFVTVEFEDGRLSITGVEGPLKNGDALGGCGQIDMSLRESDRIDWQYNAGWDSELMDLLLEVWSIYHLNDMQAGTPRQTAYLRWWKEQDDSINALNYYDRACAALREAGMYVDENPEEQMKWGVGRGYAYGHGWLTVEVPDTVIEWLFNLPESTKTPAWH